MADNNYKDGNSLGSFYKRSNPLTGNQGMKMRVEKPYGEYLELVGDLVIDTAANTATFTPASPTSAYDARYFQIVITDQSGNQAATTDTGTLSSPIVVDTTALNEQDEWLVNFYFSTDKEVNTDNGDKTYATIEVKDVASDPTISINTVALNQPKIAVFEADGTTAIADAGAAYNVGTFPAGGGSIAQEVIVRNNSDFVLEITSVAIGGDVDGGANAVSQYIYPGDQLAVPFTVDTSGTAGSYTGTVTLASTATNASFVVNVAFTLS